jgi:hypothetical protein
VKDLTKEQLEDGDVAVIWKWLKTKEEPMQKEIYLASPAVKAYWLNKEAFEVCFMSKVMETRNCMSHQV